MGESEQGKKRLRRMLVEIRWGGRVKSRVGAVGWDAVR